ncbi:MAG: SpoIIE family protein phosphatase [Planctomycetota bacterium]
MDKILELNGKSYETFDERNALLDFEMAHVNEYLIERDGEILTVRVTNSEMGLRRVVVHSGLLWVLGMIFLSIGILVFLMKPFHGPSWAFLIMTMILGVAIPYYNPLYFYRPSWLDNILIFFLPLLPASILHLAVLFPERRAFFTDRKGWIIAPYIASLTLAVLSRAFASRIGMLPDFFLSVIYFYLFSSLLLFLVSTIHSYIRTTSVAVRLQSLAIFSGITVALFIPLVELLSNLVFKVSLFPNPILFYLFFLVFFPLSIGYAIVRHDLFEVDVIVRRTYGYVLSTAAIIGAFVLIQSLLNVAFQTSEISRSPLFPILFALGVVFLFKPLHERFQGFVDRVFYRQQYDYRKTIKDVSETMIRILNPGEIYGTLVGSAVKEMSLENGVIFLPDPARQGYRLQAAEGIDTKELVSGEIDNNDPLLRAIEEKKDAIFRHDLDLHPLFEGSREVLQNTFRSFASELMLPLKYKDEIRGIISLGRKKSGKMFTPEDLDLLKTLINQSAVALENAKLFEENLEKGRMEEELKIAHDIQVGMLPEKAPSIEGFKIAASSIPAKEVGGDFYDFIEMGGNGTGGKLGIVVGDVSGKAVSGALVMAASRSIFRVLAEVHATTVKEVMSTGNVRLNSDVKKGMFVALVYAVLDPRQKTLTLSNAGQTQPVICSNGSSTPVYIDTEGDRFPLGIIKDCDYQETQVQLKQGDTVVFYTDGVVEAMNGKGELYGFERFLTSIEKAKELDANTLLEKLMDDVESYVGDVEQHDDLTIVVVKVG